MKKELFTELAKPLMKILGKNINGNVYNNFIDYLIRNNIEHHMKNIKPDTFKEYFDEFSLWYFGNSDGKRLDFSEQVKTDLLKRSGGCCVVCGTLTIFPQESEKNKSLVIAAACHIKPASKYGPRANPEEQIDIKEISSIENGLWACLNCHKIIDTECQKYTVEYLKELRNKHEQSILSIKDKRPDIRQIIEALQIRDNSKYAYVNAEEFEENSLLTKKLLSKSEKIEELYAKLKEVEKTAIEDLSLFRMIKELNLKKESVFGKGSLGIKISDDEFIMQIGVENMDNIESKFKEYAEQFKTELKYEVMNYGYTTHNKKHDLVRSISDYTKICEFFIINETEKNIIKMKNDDFKIYPIKNELNLPSISITKINTNFNSIVRIDMTRNGDITKSVISTSKLLNNNNPDILDFFREFSFIEYLEEFNFFNFNFLVRFKDIIFEYKIDIK